MLTQTVFYEKNGVEYKIEADITPEQKEEFDAQETYKDKVHYLLTLKVGQ